MISAATSAAISVTIAIKRSLGALSGSSKIPSLSFYFGQGAPAKKSFTDMAVPTGYGSKKGEDVGHPQQQVGLSTFASQATILTWKVLDKDQTSRLKGG